MCELVPFKREHLLNYMGQSSNEGLSEWMEQFGAEQERWDVYARTLMLDGKAMVSGGILELWPGRGNMWVWFNEDSKRNFVPVMRGMMRFLHESPFKRVEMATLVEDERAQRRAKIAGFELECECAKAYFPDGEDATTYAWVRE